MLSHLLHFDFGSSIPWVGTDSQLCTMNLDLLHNHIEGVSDELLGILEVEAVDFLCHSIVEALEKVAPSTVQINILNTIQNSNSRTYVNSLQ